MSDELYRRVIRHLSKNCSSTVEELNKKLDSISYIEDDFKDEFVTFVLVNNLHDSREMKEILDIKIEYFKEHNKEGLSGEYGIKVKKDLENTLKKYEGMINLVHQI